MQEVTVQQLRQGTWNRTSFTKQRYGSSLNEWDDVTKSVVQKNPLPAIPDACPNLLPVSRVYAVTLMKEHSCLAVSLPDPPAPSGSSCTTSVPSSASALQRAGVFGRKVPAQQLTAALRAGFELHERKWNGKQVFAEIRKLDPSTNIHMAYNVLSRLRRPMVMSAPFNPILIQGLASALRQEGWGVVLHVADAESVCSQIEDIARKQYAAHCRAHPESRKFQFDVTHISAVLEQYSSEEAKAQDYVMGFTLVPPNIMNGGLAHFPPVDAIDAASMREFAAGVMINRATKDGNDNVHMISTSVMLASESALSLDAVQSAEGLLLGPDTPLSHADRVTITDGGVALIGSQRKHHPRAAMWRCYRHLKADLLKRCKASALILDKLVKLPPGRVRAADEIMAGLPTDSPLHKVPREQFCQAYLASNVSLHGNVTNNMVEISNHMLARARTEELLFKSMQVTAETVKHRLDELRSIMLEKKASALDKPAICISPEDSFPEGCVTPATQRAWEIVQATAKDLPPPVRVARDGVVTTDEFEVRWAADKASRVNLSYLPHGPYLALCDCGKSSSHKLWCPCVQSVFHHSTGDWRRWLKPWRSSTAWEKQLEPAFNSPTGVQICGQVKFLHDEGSLHELKQPSIRPTPKGRPVKLKPTAASKRIHSCLEGVADSVRAQRAAGDVAAGLSLSKNPGGRGVKKKCGRCGETGHRRSNCPLLVQDRSAVEEEPAPQEEEPAQDAAMNEVAEVAAMEEEPAKDQPKKEGSKWKPRGQSTTGSRLSSALPAVPQGSELYPRFFLTRSLSGLEKACLLLRGAKEHTPDVPDAELTPLAEDKAFKRNSSLKSFWNMLERDPAKVPADECYFGRIEGPADSQTCTGLALLQRSALPTATKPYHQFDIKAMCSTGAGKGTLLMFKLLTFLKAQDADTHVYVRLMKSIASSAGFYLKMGFEAMGPRVKSGDALYLDMSTDVWREVAQKRMGGVVEVLDETEALPVSAEDGLMNSLWTLTERKDPTAEEKPSNAVQPSTSKPSTSAEPSAQAEPSAEETMFGEGALLLGQRVTVRGNGTCWLYAVMAGLGVLDHANPRPLRGVQQEMRPTDGDYKLSDLFLSKMKAEVKLMRYTASDHEYMAKKYVATKKASGEKGGGNTDYAVLAYMLQCYIVMLDKAKPSKVICYVGNKKGTTKELSTSDFAAFMRNSAENNEPTLVVEFDGFGHYAAYVSPPSYRPEQPVWLKAALAKRPVK